MCVIDTSPTLPSDSSSSNAAMSSSPASVIGATRSSIPCESRSICQGTMLEWCSMAEISTAWPGLSRWRPRLWATRLMPSVLLRTRTISSRSRAVHQRGGASRAAS